MMTNRVLVLAVATALPACFLQGCKDESGGGGGGDKPDVKKENELKKLVDDAGYTPEQRDAIAKMMQELFKDGDKDSKVQFTTSDDLFQKNPQSLVGYLFTHDNRDGSDDITPFDDCFTTQDIQKPFMTDVDKQTKEPKMPDGWNYPRVTSSQGLLLDIVVQNEMTFVSTPNSDKACAEVVWVRSHAGDHEIAHMNPNDKPAEEKPDLARNKRNDKKTKVVLQQLNWLTKDALPYSKKNNGILAIATPQEPTVEGFYVATKQVIIMVVESIAEAQTFEMQASKSTAEFTKVNALAEEFKKVHALAEGDIITPLTFNEWSWWRDYVVDAKTKQIVQKKTANDGEIGANRPHAESALYAKSDELKAMYDKIKFDKIYTAFRNDAINLVIGEADMKAEFDAAVKETNDKIKALNIDDLDLDAGKDGMGANRDTYRICPKASRKKQAQVDEIAKAGWDYGVQGNIPFANNKQMDPIIFRFFAKFNGSQTQAAINTNVWKYLNDMFKEQGVVGKWTDDIMEDLNANTIRLPKVLLKAIADNLATPTVAIPETVFPKFDNWNADVKKAEDDDESKLQGYAQFDSAGRLESTVMKTLQVIQCSTNVEMLGAQIVATAGAFADVYNLEADEHHERNIYLGHKNTEEDEFNDKGKCVDPSDNKKTIKCTPWEYRCTKKDIIATKKSIPAKILFQGKGDLWRQGWTMALEAFQAPKAAAPAA